MAASYLVRAALISGRDPARSMQIDDWPVGIGVAELSPAGLPLAPPPAAAATPFAVVTSVAGLLGESRDVRQVFPRLAEAARAALRFDWMGVLRLEGEDALRVYAVAADGGLHEKEGRLIPSTHYSPRLWRTPMAWPSQRADRVDVDELDRRYQRDRELLEAGVQSIIRAPLQSMGRTVGVLGFTSRRRRAFTSADDAIVLALADLVGTAIEHERRWEGERERRRRSDLLEALLPTVAQALDIGAVFEQVSKVTQNVIPHDLLTLGLLSADGRTVRVYTTAEGGYREFAQLPTLNELLMTDREFLIIRDIAVGERSKGLVHFLPFSSEERPPAWREAHLDPPRMRLLSTLGLRSGLGVPVRSGGKVAGELMFYTRCSDSYRPDDADLARRIADHVGLALAYQQLALEERRSAAAQHRAQRLEVRVQSLAEELKALGGQRQVVGESAAWKHVLKQATQVAATHTTVLLLGESGTGKEIVARLLHRASPRADGPYLALNCAALPDPLLESELFGYERGAFTGATQAKAGQLERAAGGVLFLDEVGEMSASLQAKLLRVLQEREYQRLGGTRVLATDVRVVAATNRDLRAAVERGSFREDLYYRLNVFEIRLPALRDRTEDIQPLIRLFLGEIGRTLGRPPAGLSHEARERLLHYHWPGNVRELRNVLERAAILCEGAVIGPEHLALSGPSLRAGADVEKGDDASRIPETAADLSSHERRLVESALRDARYNKSVAARKLGLTRKQLYVRLRRYRIS